MTGLVQFLSGDTLGNVTGVGSATPLPVAMTGTTSAAPLETRERGAAAIATGQVSVGTGNTQVIAARSGRQAVTITNLGTGVVYLGNTGVLSTTGMILPGVIGASITIPTQGAVFGIAPVAQSVAFLETF